ncbi:MAG: hypothetical protein HRT88_20625, partial [Lentisphaeraceae bacterium]|nr:hypothetical protein [Lentisphaeraceae bacterium]
NADIEVPWNNISNNFTDKAKIQSLAAAGNVSNKKTKAKEKDKRWFEDLKESETGDGIHS